jgi:hypothetical protein
VSDTPNEINEMVERWLTELPPKTRKTAKSDVNTALNLIADDNILTRARTDPTELLRDLDDGLRARGFAGTTRNKIKSVFRRWLRYYGIETMPENLLNTRPYRYPVLSRT